MAAKASLILEEVERDLNKAYHAFGYAPGMDAPYLGFDEWSKSYRDLETALGGIRALLAQARAGEQRLGNPATAEACRAAYWDMADYDFQAAAKECIKGAD